jgi:5'-nucleotidase
MKINTRRSLGLGTLALVTSLLVSSLVPSAQAATYSLPNAPLLVTSSFGSSGIVVRWTPGDAVTPEVTGYVVSAGAGSCPIFVPAKKRGNIVVMPVVVGQPGGTPVVQAVNAYGFSKPTASPTTYTAA